MSLSLEGKLHKIFDAVQVSDKFTKREFVLETSGQYPQFVPFQLTQDRCTAIDPFKVGDSINTFFDIRGNEWKDKYYCNLQAWKLEKISDAPQVTAPESKFNEPQVLDRAKTNFEGTDDFPF